MNKKNVLVSSLMFGLLMVSAAQCPSKSKDEGVSEKREKDERERNKEKEREKEVNGLKDDISRLLGLGSSNFESYGSKLVESIRGHLVRLDVNLEGENIPEFDPGSFGSGTGGSNLNLPNFIAALFRRKVDEGPLKFGDLEEFMEVSGGKTEAKRIFLNSINLEAVGKLTRPAR